MRPCRFGRFGRRGFWRRWGFFARCRGLFGRWFVFDRLARSLKHRVRLAEWPHQVQHAECLAETVSQIDLGQFDSNVCASNAKLFNAGQFRERFSAYLSELFGGSREAEIAIPIFTPSTVTTTPLVNS